MANGLEVEIEALEKLIEAGEVKTGDQVSSVCRWQLVQPNWIDAQTSSRVCLWGALRLRLHMAASVYFYFTSSRLKWLCCSAAKMLKLNLGVVMLTWQLK